MKMRIRKEGIFIRIGKFAEVNNLSIDTVRYYMDLKLIHPFLKGKYFHFEKEQQDELDRLMYLKKLRFTLEDIRKIVTVQDLSKIKTEKESSIYINMLLRKREDLRAEISDLSGVLGEIEKEIESLNEKHVHSNRERGISFKNLGILSCPQCGNEIEITEGILKGNSIYEGESVCVCGYSLSINQGIIVTKHDCHNIIEPYSDDNNYIDEFANEAPKTFVDLMMNSSKEVIRLLQEKALSDKVLLFMKSGLGFLETTLLEQVQVVKLMILVDDDFNKLRIAKKSIESTYQNTNIIYICSELNELPLRRKNIDIAIDFLATFINGFRVDINIYEYIIPMLKDKSCIIGLYLYFRHFKMLERLSERHRRLFDGRTIPQYIKQNSYIETSSYDEDILQEGTNINDFFRDGDKVYSKIIVYER